VIAFTTGTDLLPGDWWGSRLRESAAEPVEVRTNALPDGTEHAFAPLLEVPRATLPALEPDTYYVFELRGLEVVEEGGERLGRVRDVVPYPANDVLELDSGIDLPLVEACVRTIDLDAGRILVTRGFAAPG